MHQAMDSGVAVVVAAAVVVVVVAAALASFQCRPCSVGSWCWCRIGICLAVD